MKPVPFEPTPTEKAHARRDERHRRPAALSSNVVDEAFAELPIRLADNNRVDPPCRSCKSQAQGPWTNLARTSKRLLRVDQELYSSLATELTALDRRCERLTRLLQSLDAEADAD